MERTSSTTASSGGRVTRDTVTKLRPGPDKHDRDRHQTATGDGVLAAHAERSDQEHDPEHRHGENRRDRAGPGASSPVERPDNEGEQGCVPAQRPHAQAEDRARCNQRQNEHDREKAHHEHSTEKDLLAFGQLVTEPVVAHDVGREHGPGGERLRIERRHDRGKNTGGEEPSQQPAGMLENQAHENRSLERRREVDVADDAEDDARNPNDGNAQRIEDDRRAERLGALCGKPMAEDMREYPRRKGISK